MDISSLNNIFNLLSDIICIKSILNVNVVLVIITGGAAVCCLLNLR